MELPVTVHRECQPVATTIIRHLPPACLQYYLANDQKLKKFVPIIQNSLVYPAIYDANRTLLSLPPIINGAHSAVGRAIAFSCFCSCRISPTGALHHPT